MSYRKSLSYIARQLKNPNDSNAFKDMEELVERATPKKPEITIYNGFCPNCHQAFGFERTRQAMLRPYWLSFCPVCGQALDWSEDNE